MVQACLGNHQIRDMLAPGEASEKRLKASPIVRIDFEQAHAIGGIGETLQATRSKYWGDGPYVLPLEPEDQFFPDRITYVYKPESLYNRRFEHRIRMKELLGRHRKLVGEAKDAHQGDLPEIPHW